MMSPTTKTRRVVSTAAGNTLIPFEREGDFILDAVAE
jgi:hypothetical protein